MFWIVDNFLMQRKIRKGITLKADDRSGVKFVARLRDVNASDDEIVLHSLMDNESHDTIITEDHDVIQRHDYTR